MIKVVCINDEARPNEIPLNKWVKKDEMYEIIKITIHPNQKFINGVELAEISLTEEHLPYEYFKLDRFRFKIEDIPTLIELMKDSSELDNIDLEELLLESIGELV